MPWPINNLADVFVAGLAQSPTAIDVSIAHSPSTCPKDAPLVSVKLERLRKVQRRCVRLGFRVCS